MSSQVFCSCSVPSSTGPSWCPDASSAAKGAPGSTTKLTLFDQSARKIGPAQVQSFRLITAVELTKAWSAHAWCRGRATHDDCNCIKNCHLKCACIFWSQRQLTNTGQKTPLTAYHHQRSAAKRVPEQGVLAILLGSIIFLAVICI